MFTHKWIVNAYRRLLETFDRKSIYSAGWSLVIIYGDVCVCVTSSVKMIQEKINKTRNKQNVEETRRKGAREKRPAMKYDALVSLRPSSTLAMPFHIKSKEAKDFTNKFSFRWYSRKKCATLQPLQPAVLVVFSHPSKQVKPTPALIFFFLPVVRILCCMQIIRHLSLPLYRIQTIAIDTWRLNMNCKFNQLNFVLQQNCLALLFPKIDCYPLETPGKSMTHRSKLALLCIFLSLIRLHLTYA